MVSVHRANSFGYGLKSLGTKTKRRYSQVVVTISSFDPKAKITDPHVINRHLLNLYSRKHISSNYTALTPDSLVIFWERYYFAWEVRLQLSQPKRTVENLHIFKDILLECKEELKILWGVTLPFIKNPGMNTKLNPCLQALLKVMQQKTNQKS